MLGTGLFSPKLAGATTGYPLISTYTDMEVGSDVTGWVALQSPDGTMNFGCRELVSFDGERWRTTSLSGGHAVRGLDLGADGRMWAAAMGEIGWFTRENGAWSYHSLRAFLPAEHAMLGEVWHAFADGDGAIFTSEDRIFRWDGHAFEVWVIPGSRRLRTFRVDGRILVQHRPTGLYSLGKNGPELLVAATELGQEAIFAIERAGDGWNVVNEQGLLHLAGGRVTKPSPSADDFIKKHALNSAVRLPDGRLALATTKDGIAILAADGSLDQVIGQSAGLSAPSVNSLFVDREGALWATSSSAIFRVAINSSSTLFDVRSGLPGQQVSRITKHEGRIVLANSDGLYVLAADGQSLVRNTSLGGPFAALRSTPAGLFAGGYRRLVQISDGVAKVIFTSERDVFAIAPSLRAPERLLVAEGRNIMEVSPATGESRLLVTGLPDIPVSIAEDAAGSLWIGTSASGIFVAQPGEVAVAAVAVGESSGIASDRSRGLVARAEDGTIFAFNARGGWMRPPNSTSFQAIKDHPARAIAGIASDFDRDGHLWIVHATTNTQPATVARITRTGRQATWEAHAVEGLSTIGGPRCIFVEATGETATTLWIGGSRALLRHVVTNGPAAPQPQPPLLNALARGARNGALQPITAALPYSTSAIEFEFAQPEFSRRPMLRLETRIEGMDRDWVRVGRDSRRELTGVRDGNYTLQVRAVAETGVASAPTVFAFAVAPPWWRTLPALLGVVFALAPMAYGLYRLRLHALRRRTVELEAKVRQRTEQLEQASAAKTVFVANMSHDIRNPLNGIVGLALALEDTRLDPKQREIVATLRECTTYLSSLVDDVLDFASIEAGRVELRPGPFVPAELLRSIVTTLKADTAESGARLHIDVDPRLPANLSGDAGRIQQILVNYVSNALKYAGGEIHLAATIPVGSPDEVEFAVTDGGPGISTADQATLFTKFTRLTSAREHDIPGAGLGLASCRLLADIMSGSVGVESQPGHGARFYLRLPLTPADAPVAPETGDLPNTTVLLVEDTDYNAMAATAVLRRLGLTCERARTGAEALEMFAAKRFNLVLLDRNLPDMDGTEIARQMRERESTDGLRSIILAVTAYCTAEDRKLCLDAGMDAFVGKPLTPEKMRKVLLAAGRRMLAAATFDATPAIPAAAPLDTTLLDYLGDGTDGGLAGQIDRFLTSLVEAQTQLVRANETRDYSTLALTAHRLLGQARMVGGGTLGDAALALEQAADRCDADACDDLLRQVTGEIRTITAALRHRRSGALTS